MSKLGEVLEETKEIVAKTSKSLKNVLVDTNSTLTVTRRPKKAAAQLFTGKNGAEIVAFVKAHAGEEVQTRNGGSYVTLTAPNQGGRARKGDWVVVDSDGSLLVLTPENFNLLFSIKG